MGMTRTAKEKSVADLTEKLGRARAALVANFSGLNVAAVTEIRRKFREANVEYRVVKNTLMRRALSGTTREGVADAFTGPTAIAFKYDEEYALLGKAAQEMEKKYEAFKVKAAFIEDDVLEGTTAVSTMAALPTMDEARAQLLGVINAPAAKLLAQINAPASHLIGVIKAKSEKES